MSKIISCLKCNKELDFKYLKFNNCRVAICDCGSGYNLEYVFGKVCEDVISISILSKSNYILCYWQDEIFFDFNKEYALSFEKFKKHIKNDSYEILLSLS